MEIDALAGLSKHLTSPKPVTPEAALPGRAKRVLDPIPVHTVLGLPLDEVPADAEVAYFALGCFWGVERLFWETEGVVNTAVGYMGGFTANPVYTETCTGRTGHAETVQVVFDPGRVSYERLLVRFWESHDPTQRNRQGNDVGTHYRSAIFPQTKAQHDAAVASQVDYQTRLTAAGYGTVTTEVTDDQRFYYAEEEHQQYLDKNPAGYQCDHRTGVSFRQC